MTPFYICQVGCPYDSKFNEHIFILLGFLILSETITGQVTGEQSLGSWGFCTDKGCSQEQYLWRVRKAGLGKGRRWARMQLRRGLRWLYTELCSWDASSELFQVETEGLSLVGCWLSPGRDNLGRGSFLQLRTIPQEELSCEPPAATSEFLDPRGLCGAHSIHCIPIMGDCILLS